MKFFRKYESVAAEQGGKKKKVGAKGWRCAKNAYLCG